MNLILAVLGAFACLALFFYALRAGWFTRMEKGFLATMIFAIAGFSLLAITVLGVWQYQAGQEIIHQETVGSLGHVGDIVQASLNDAINIEVDQLSRYARQLPEPKPENAAQLSANLRYMDVLNDEILQIDAFDIHGIPVSSSNANHAAEAVENTAIGWALDGKRYVSDAYLSPAAERYV